jgi:hypothetical protein
VSVHLAEELGHYPQFASFLEASGVELCVMDSRASVPGEPPLVPVVTFLQTARTRAGDHPFAIINADIALASPSGTKLARGVAALEPDESLLGQRTDWLLRGGRLDEQVFPFGFDFMAFHGSCIGRLDGLLSPALRLGRPWWDHYVPLAVLAIGGRLMLLSPGCFRHAVHADRWSTQHYVRVGRAATTHFREALVRSGNPDGARGWLDATSGEVLLPWMPASVASRVLRAGMHASAPTFFTAFLLSRLAAAHMRLILQSAWTAPVPTGSVVVPPVHSEEGGADG